MYIQLSLQLSEESLEPEFFLNSVPFYIGFWAFHWHSETLLFFVQKQSSECINKINFSTIFKCKDKYVKLQFYQVKKIQFQSHLSYHLQTFINFPHTFHSIYLNPNTITFFTLSLQIITNPLPHFHFLIQTKLNKAYKPRTSHTKKGLSSI